MTTDENTHTRTVTPVARPLNAFEVEHSALNITEPSGQALLATYARDTDPAARAIAARYTNDARLLAALSNDTDVRVRTHLLANPHATGTHVLAALSRDQHLAPAAVTHPALNDDQAVQAVRIMRNPLRRANAQLGPEHTERKQDSHWALNATAPHVHPLAGRAQLARALGHVLSYTGLRGLLEQLEQAGELDPVTRETLRPAVRERLTAHRETGTGHKPHPRRDASHLLASGLLLDLEIPWTARTHTHPSPGMAWWLDPQPITIAPAPWPADLKHTIVWARRIAPYVSGAHLDALLASGTEFHHALLLNRHLATDTKLQLLLDNPRLLATNEIIEACIAQPGDTRSTQILLREIENATYSRPHTGHRDVRALLNRRPDLYTALLQNDDRTGLHAWLLSHPECSLEAALDAPAAFVLEHYHDRPMLLAELHQRVGPDGLSTLLTLASDAERTLRDAVDAARALHGAHTTTSSITHERSTPPRAAR